MEREVLNIHILNWKHSLRVSLPLEHLSSVILTCSWSTLTKRFLLLIISNSTSKFVNFVISSLWWVITSYLPSSCLMACSLLNHVYIQSFRTIIEATETFLGVGDIWSPGMDFWWVIWTAFLPREVGIWTKIFQKFKCPGGLPGGGGCLSFDLTDI